MHRPSPVRLALSALLLLLSAVALGACGGSDSETATAAGESGGEKQQSARVKLQSCLRDQGVEVPGNPSESGPPSGQVDLQKLRAAIEGPCAKYREGALGEVGGGGRPDMEGRMDEYVACLRQHGVDAPDDPKVREAQAACRDLMPQGVPGV